jgi:hypothetical protein
MTLGRTPEQLTLVVNPGADFVANLKVQRDGAPYSWPTGTTLVLGIQIGNRPETSWSFTLSGNTASLVIPESELRAVVQRRDSNPRARLYLRYGDEQPILWAAGKVQVNG